MSEALFELDSPAVSVGDVVQYRIEGTCGSIKPRTWDWYCRLPVGHAGPHASTEIMYERVEGSYLGRVVRTWPR